MKTASIVLSILLIGSIVAGGLAFVTGQERSIAAVFDSSHDQGDVATITEAITAGDVISAEAEVEAEIEREHATSRVSAHQIITSGDGWIVTDNKKAALVTLFVVGKQAVSTEGAEVALASHGWIKLGKLKLQLESTQDTETAKTFVLKNDESAVSGTLTLQRSADEVYDGLAIWRGDLTLRVGTDQSFSGDVVIALQEKRVGAQKFEEYREKVRSSYIGSMQLDQLQLRLQSTTNSNLDRLVFHVSGEKGVTGEMTLERDGDVYVGHLNIAEDDGDDRLSARVIANLVREGRTLSGEIKAELDEHSSAGVGTYEGTITIYEEKMYSTVPHVEERGTPSENSGTNDRGDARVEKDRSGSNSGTDREISERAEAQQRGLWKRILEFFGAN